MLDVALQRRHPQAIVPSTMSSGAAGYDLAACLPDGASQILEPGQRALVPTGWAIALPPGHEAQVRPRSGLALRHGVTVLNAPGTIDADYRGEIGVLLVNLGSERFEICHGQRIAQLVIASVVAVRWVHVEILPDTPRGESGFGSTGHRSE